MQNSSEAPEWFFRKNAVALIILGLLAIIGFLLFSDSSGSPTIVSEKTDPYVLSTKGKTLIIRDKTIIVDENKQEPIFEGDKIKTLHSTATVFWPDGSITRLWEKSSITIHEMKAKTANESIRVDFSLESGKSWSNVVKYLFGDSYFHERFNNDNSLAAIRGTVFEVNLDKKYLHTVDHGVSVQSTVDAMQEILVVTDGVISTETMKILPKSDIDAAWNQLNRDADLIYLNQRMDAVRKQIMDQAGKTNRMDAFLQKVGLKKADSSLQALLSGDEAEWAQLEQTMKKTSDTAQLLDIYQAFYGLPNTDATIDTKMRLRDLILETAPAEQKKGLLDDFARSILYDSWSAETVWTGGVSKIQEKLQDKLQNYILQGADRTLISTLEDVAKQERLRKINSILEDAKQGILQTLGKKNLMEEAKKDMNLEGIKEANDAATEVRESIMDKFKNPMR